MNPLLTAAGRCRASGDLTGAEGRLRALVAAGPDNPDAWCDLAIVVSDRGQLASAEPMAVRAMRLAPDDRRILNTLGVIVKQRYRYDEALKIFEYALSCDGDRRRDVLINRALTLYEAGDLAGSEASFGDAMDLSEEQEWQSSISQEMAYPVLASGDLRRGFALMEHRWHRLARSLVWDLGIPEWQGEDIAGGTLLVHQDQGHGDVIQFCRYLRHERFARTTITLAVARPLVRLLAPIFRDRDVLVLERDGPLPIAHFHVPICSLPYHLRVSLDEVTGEPYLNGNHVECDRLPDRGGFKVGLVWAAEARLNGPRRSIPLERLLPLALLPGVTLYALQHGPRAADVEGLGAGALVEDMSPLVRDFGDTAALMSQMDLVVSADSAPAHLAGALGVPVVMFSDHVPCWRWFRGRSDTPWYDSMRLVRQERPGDWSPVVDEITRIVSGRETNQP